MLQHKPFCKNLLNKGKKEKWTHLFKQARVDSFLSTETTPAEPQQCCSTFQMTLHKAPVFKTHVCLFFLVLSQDSEHSGATEKALGKCGQSVHAKSIFHIFIHAVASDPIRSYFAVSPSLTSQSKILFWIPWCKLLMLQKRISSQLSNPWHQYSLNESHAALRWKRLGLVGGGGGCAYS